MPAHLEVTRGFPNPVLLCTAQICSGILQELAGICWPSREGGEVTDVVTVNVDCSTSIPFTFFHYSQHDGHRASLSNVLSILSSICHMCCFLNISLPPPGAKKLDKDILKYFSHLPFFSSSSLAPKRNLGLSHKWISLDYLKRKIYFQLLPWSR